MRSTCAYWTHLNVYSCTAIPKRRAVLLDLLKVGNVIFRLCAGVGARYVLCRGRAIVRQNGSQKERIEARIPLSPGPGEVSMGLVLPDESLRNGK